MPKHTDNQASAQPVLFEEISLRGAPPPLKIQHSKVPTDKVRFDLDNPRLKYKQQLFPDKTIKELLFAEHDTPWLLKDIEANGVLDPIYVRAEDGFYKAVEGNRRTAVMQELLTKYPDNPNFAYIPARILPQQTTEEQEALLMASFHVAGKVKWEAHEKAGHIYEMLEILHLPITELVATLHMGAPAIKKAAESYKLLEHFKRVDGGKYAAQAEGKWSFFSEMLKVKEFHERHQKSQDWDDEFCRWVGEGRLPRAEAVRDLEAILKKVRAKTVFESEAPEFAYEKALKEVDRSDPSRNSRFYKHLENMIISGRDATLSDLEAASSNEAARDALLEAHSVLLSFMEKSGVRIPATARRPV